MRARWASNAAAPFPALRPLVLGLAVVAGLAQLAAAEVRVALVIGNSSYANAPTLKNPANDARDVAAALEDLNFEVLLGIDLDRRGMTGVIEQFGSLARGSDVALFYYAGHGFQLDATNFLVPVDARLANATRVTSESIVLDAVMARLQRSKGLRLVFLDACRNNPLGAVASGSRRVEDGLARVGSAADFLIAFATQPDNVAYDGLGRNSFFTEALLSHIHTPGQTIAELMISVRRDVLAATGGRQVPWENSSLTRDFRFDPRPATAAPETMLWQVAASAADPELMRLYLSRYPEGPHVRDVLAFLERAAVAGAIESDTRRLPAADANVDQEDRLWELAQRTRMRQLVEFYLSNFPEGRHRDAALRLRATLPEIDDLAPARLCERLATHPRDATANTAGVTFDVLARNAAAAIEACSAARATFPERPHYAALLARAKIAAGLRDEAIALYRAASDQGDLRAMVSLGLILEAGDGVAQDVPAALALYERAAAAGSADGAINLAVALFQGRVIERDLDRAVDLLVLASEAGSAIATYNLGVLAQDGVRGVEGEAIEYFRRAARAGEPRGYLAAAILLDEGRGIQPDPEAAATMLLRGAAADNGETIASVTGAAGSWTQATLLSVQERLAEAGLYPGPHDGIGGPALGDALRAWRNGGYRNDLVGG